MSQDLDPENMSDWAKILWRQRMPQPGDVPPTLEELAYAYGELKKVKDKWFVPEGDQAKRDWLKQLKEDRAMLQNYLQKVLANPDISASKKTELIKSIKENDEEKLKRIEEMQAIVDRLDANF